MLCTLVPRGYWGLIGTATGRKDHTYQYNEKLCDFSSYQYGPSPIRVSIHPSPLLDPMYITHKLVPSVVSMYFGKFNVFA